MASDESDKTVFRQPSAGDGDRTQIRPTPGRRPATPSQHATPAAPPPSYVPQQPRQPQYAAARQSADHDAGNFHTGHGLNPLVNTASTLLAVFEKTRHTVSHPDVGGLHQRLVNELKNFEVQAKEQGLKPEIVLSARYALCTALDEAVLNTPWGSESAWTQRTLLSVFHNETAGGEKFFLLLDRVRQSPAENIYILELFYILLSLGFEGKYRVIHRGRETLEQIRDELFRIIRNNRGEYERELSPSWHGLGKIRNTLTQYIPVWVMASIIGAVLLLAYSGFRFWLYQSSSPVAEQLTEISQLKAVAKPGRLEEAPKSTPFE
ncbi:MAG: DotU family type IV/VI secretion system protein [Gammaproteobacteria bacterium]|nr:DotU family type IV/VI secretion system protein [Gammaproteobacteria bacterium]